MIYDHVKLSLLKIVYNSSLILAANNGHLNCVRILIEHGADIDDRSNNGKTSLLWASHWGHDEVTRYLVKKGANLHIADKDGLTVLMNAIMKGHEPIVRFLVDHGANVTALNIFNGTALSMAKAKGMDEVASWLAPYFDPSPEVQSPYLVALEIIAAQCRKAIYQLYRYSTSATSGWKEMWSRTKGVRYTMPTQQAQ